MTDTRQMPDGRVLRRDSADVADRLEIRADIRRSIDGRRSVQEAKPDRLALLLDEAAAAIRQLRILAGTAQHQAGTMAPVPDPQPRTASVPKPPKPVPIPRPLRASSPPRAPGDRTLPDVSIDDLDLSMIRLEKREEVALRISTLIRWNAMDKPSSSVTAEMAASIGVKTNRFYELALAWRTTHDVTIGMGFHLVAPQTRRKQLSDEVRQAYRDAVTLLGPSAKASHIIRHAETLCADRGVKPCSHSMAHIILREIAPDRPVRTRRRKAGDS